MAVDRISAHFALEPDGTVRVQLSGWRDNQTVAWTRFLRAPLDATNPGTGDVLRAGVAALSEALAASDHLA